MNDDVQARDPGPVEHACAPETTEYIRVPSGPLVRIQEVFHGRPLSIYMFRGRPCAIAADVGRALEYANDGKKLVDVLRQEWAAELIKGKDFDVLTGTKLAEFKEIMDATHVSWVSSTARVTVLYESGIDLVCIKTEKPLGKKLRRFLADEVLPKLRRGEPILPRDADALSGRMEMLLARVTSGETAVATLRAELAKVTANAEASRGELARITTLAEASTAEHPPTGMNAYTRLTRRP
jgi:prophage antirepressor-like protein